MEARERHYLRNKRVTLKMEGKYILAAGNIKLIVISNQLCSLGQFAPRRACQLISNRIPLAVCTNNTEAVNNNKSVVCIDKRNSTLNNIIFCTRLIFFLPVLHFLRSFLYILLLRFSFPRIFTNANKIGNFIVFHFSLKICFVIAVA